MSTPIAQGRAPGGMWRISDGLLGGVPFCHRGTEIHRGPQRLPLGVNLAGWIPYAFPRWPSVDLCVSVAKCLSWT